MPWDYCFGVERDVTKLIDIGEIASAVFQEMEALVDLIERVRFTEGDSQEEKLATHAKDFPIPTVKQLEALIEPAFWATLQLEEGRSTKFRLGIRAAEEDPSQAIFHSFKEPPSLTAELICKLAQSVDPEEAFFEVYFEGDIVRIGGIGVHPKYYGKHPFTVHAQPGGDLQFSWSMYRLVHFHSNVIDRLSAVPADCADPSELIHL